MMARLYRDEDFQGVLALINEAAAADSTRRLPEHVLRATLTGAQDSAPGAVVVEMAGGVRAFGWWETHEGKPPHANLEGWVSTTHRRHGVGTALLAAIESFVREQCGAGVVLAGRGYEDVPGLERLFVRRGFAVVRRFLVMSVRFADAEPVSAEPPPGITLRAFRRDDLEPLVDAHNAIFSDHWGSAPRSVESWQRDMIERRPHDPALWIVASTPEREGASQIVAECLSHASREGGPDDAWVSLVGVRREWRGRGLGRAVLAHGLLTLREAGYATASLHVDAENASAVHLYRSLGMDATRTRLHFEKVVRG